MAIETRSEVRGGGGGGVDPVPMPVKCYPTAAQSLGLFLARVPVGAFFVIAAWRKFFVDGKFNIKGGVDAFVNQAGGMVPSWVPPNLGHIYVTAVPYAEVVLGSLLVLGFLSRFVGALLSLMLISFMIAVPPHASGHFSDTMNFPFNPSIIYLGVCLAIVFCGPGRLSIDGLLFGPRRTVTITERYTEPLP
jgi:uncharacterized membrane protein YphA (DoxX/SURF4 family)